MGNSLTVYGLMARVAGCALGSALLVLALAAGHVSADSGPSNVTFKDEIARAKLVVLARIDLRLDGGFTLHVERVLKGSTERTLVFPPLAPTAIVDHGWRRAVIAFRDPSTLDFRSPTIAWHISANGAVDPEGYQQAPGTPKTLDELLPSFGLPATDDGQPVRTWLALTPQISLIPARGLELDVLGKAYLIDPGSGGGVTSFLASQPVGVTLYRSSDCSVAVHFSVPPGSLTGSDLNSDGSARVTLYSDLDAGPAIQARAPVCGALPTTDAVPSGTDVRADLAWSGPLVGLFVVCWFLFHRRRRVVTELQR